MREKTKTAKLPTRRRAIVTVNKDPEKPKVVAKAPIKKEVKLCAPKEVKKSIYEPIREQFMILLEYLNILDKRRSVDEVTEIGHLLDFMDIMRRKCEVYLNFQLIKAGN